VAEVASHAVEPEDALRAEVYALLSRLLYTPPKADLLEVVRGLQGDDSDMGQAVGSLAAAARGLTVDNIEDEYLALFVGLDGGELNPYGSSYGAGLHYAQPLAELRRDLTQLGIERRDSVREPEDHIAVLCGIMAGLITGQLGEGAPSLDGQRRFFDRHLAKWAPRFFEDLETAEAAKFYAPLGQIGRVFLDVERQAFDMA
jgi:TorA maturation chaperone TorD